MKQVYKFDEDGFYSGSEIIHNDLEIPINGIIIKPKEGLFKPKVNDDKSDWIEGLPRGEIDFLTGDTLESQRKQKMQYLVKRCNEEILSKRFTSIVDGTEYQFTCDSEAQSNFDKVDRAFEKGRATEVPWTAYNINTGGVVRVLMTVTNFERPYMDHLYHIQNNISKLRDILQPIVETASKEELDSIDW